MSIRLITSAFAVATLYGSYMVLAQDIGNIGRGHQIAQTICSACHQVSKGERGSPNSEAPPFPLLAAVPGMTSIALTAALQTSHRRMPNVVLEPDQRRDVVAYILSLK